MSQSFMSCVRIFVVGATIALGACSNAAEEASKPVGGSTNVTDTTAPQISSITPVNNATGIALNTAMSATFSEALNPATVTAASFTLSVPGGVIAGTVSYSGNSAIFAPNMGLTYKTTYTATLSTTVTDLAGNPLAVNYTWTFTTDTAPDTTAPTITATNPADAAAGIELNSAVSVSFSEAMNSATLTARSFTLAGPDGPVAGDVSYGDLTGIFSPSSVLMTNAIYTATVTTAAQDIARNSLASNYVWNFTTRPFTRQLGTAVADVGFSVATDNNSNVYVAGYTSGGLDGNTSTGGYNLFVVKYDANSTKLWTRQLGGSAPNLGQGVATDSSGNVYAVGYTFGSFDGNASAGLTDLFVVKYDTSGVKLWTRQLGTAASDEGHSVATDNSGNVYVAGHTSGGLDGNTSTGGYDLFVVKYDTSGTKLWTRQLGTAASDYGSSVATDSNGNLYVAGRTEGGLDGNTNAGLTDIFVVKYNASGTKLWTRQLGTTGYDDGYSVATDSSGNVYVTGATNGGLDGNTNAGRGDLFVVKYDTSGTKLWTRQLGATGYDSGFSVTTDSGGNVYVTGATDGGLDGNTNAGRDDLFVVKYDTSGSKLWTRQLGTAMHDNGYGVTTDSNSNVYVTGRTFGGLDGNTNAGDSDLFVVKYAADGTKR
jgi:hypothetical protein